MKARSAAASLVFMIVCAAPPMAVATERGGSPFQHIAKKLDALVSHVVVCPKAKRRFVHNGDGTICDSRTGLMWEKKNGADGVPNLSNPRDVDNVYTWSADGSSLDPNGTVFTDFLARLNGEIAETVASEQLAGYRDWRLPTLAELQTLHPDSCTGSPCVVHPIFLPTAPFLYWTATSVTGEFVGPRLAWGVFFNVEGAIDVEKTIPIHARAVRGGR